MTFASRAKRLKDKSGKTLQQIAAACYVSESMVSRYLNGVSIPPDDVAEKILTYLVESAENAIKEEEKEMQALFSDLRQVYQDRIDDLWKIIDKHTRYNVILFAAVCFMFFVSIYLVIDGINGDWGLFQYSIK